MFFLIFVNFALDLASLSQLEEGMWNIEEAGLQGKTLEEGGIRKSPYTHSVSQTKCVYRKSVLSVELV